MKFGIVLTACLIVLATSSSLRSNEVKSTLLQVDQSTLGNAILSTIHLQMMSGGATDTIKELLVEIKEDLQQQAADSQTEATAASEKCESDRATQQGQVDDYQGQIDDYAAQIAADADRKAQVTSDLADANARNTTLHGDLDSLDSTREEQAAMHAAFDGDYDKAIQACEDCIDIIRRLEDTDNPDDVEKALEGPVSLVLAQMDDQMKLEYGPTIESLAQLALTADQGAVAEIINLLEEIIQKFKDARDAQGTDEATAIDNYNAARQNILDAITENNTEIARLEGALAELNSSTAEESKAAAERDLDLAQAALDDLNDACDVEAGQYAQKGIDISEEIAIIEQVEGIIASQIDPFEDYLVERADF